MKKITFFLTILILISASLAFGDFNRGKELYELALKETETARKIQLLEEAATAHRDFNAFYELGKVYMRVGRLNRAEESFSEAFDCAETNQDIAKALVGRGQAYLAMDKEPEAIVCFRLALDKHHYPKVESKLKQIEWRRTQEGMDAEYIKRALSVDKALFGVAPALNIRVHFRFDSAELDPLGKVQVEALGNALTDLAFEGRTITLIGHTDNRGTHQYNQGLSERRALTVMGYLVKYFELDSDQLKTRGKGEEDLLYAGSSSQEHALNRRVEVRVD